jgi:signal transduction histidine kinase
MDLCAGSFERGPDGVRFAAGANGTMAIDAAIASRTRYLGISPGTALKLAVPVYLLCLAAILISRTKGMLPPIWPANAVIVCAMLAQSRSQWPALMALAGIADAAAAFSVGDSFVQAMLLPVCNLLECFIVAWPLRITGADKDFTRPKSLLMFYALASMAPAISSLCGVAFLHLEFGRPFVSTLFTWYGAAVLGLFILVPPIMTVRLRAVREMFSADQLSGTLVMLLIILAVVGFNYSLRDHPFSFLFFPAVILLTFQRGLPGGAAGVLIAGAYLMMPVLLGKTYGVAHGYSPLERLMVVQAFVAVMGFSVVLIGAALEERHRLARGLGAAIEQAERAREDAVVAREEALAAREDAEKANRAKSMFLANMSHELRTPLNAVIGFSETMNEETFGPHGHAKYKEYSSLISGAGAHLLDLINDILDMSRVEAGRFELHPENLEIIPLVRDCENMMKENATQAGLTLTTELPPQLPTVFADRRALKQILLNLTANAVKFTPPGGRVEISVVSDGTELEFRVRDTGIGIPADKLAQVGNPFVQFHAMTGKQGTGLGLALVRSLTQLQGGTFRIASREGEGTLVCVSFPAGCADRAAA